MSCLRWQDRRQPAQRGILCTHRGETQFPVCDFQLINSATFQNVFSSRLGEVDDGFNFFTLLVVDLLHEFELGVWKTLLTHLIRILHTQGEDKVMEFNNR